MKKYFSAVLALILIASTMAVVKTTLIPSTQIQAGSYPFGPSNIQNSATRITMSATRENWPENGAPVLAGAIAPNGLYWVRNAAIVYNGQTIRPDTTFRGVDGVTTFSGDGAVFEAEIFKLNIDLSTDNGQTWTTNWVGFAAAGGVILDRQGNPLLESSVSRDLPPGNGRRLRGVLTIGVTLTTSIAVTVD
jgi:hypothetical protein